MTKVWLVAAASNKMAASRSFISNGSEYVPLDLKKGELSFAMAPFNPEANIHNEGHSPQQIKEIVKNSSRLKSLIREVKINNNNDDDD